MACMAWYIYIYHMPHAHDNVNMYGKPCGKTICHIPYCNLFINVNLLEAYKLILKTNIPMKSKSL